MKGKCKLIIDTNLWISFLLTGKYDFLLDLLEKECIVIVFCDALLDEFIRVSQRSKLKKMFSKNDWDTISDLIVKHAIFCKLESDIDLCRDKKDNFLLSLAIDSNADYIITGDKDLLVLEKIGETKIISMSAFKDIAGKLF